MTTVDCGLLDRIFDADPNRWSPIEQVAVTGLTTPQQCQDWVDLFLDNIDPVAGCSGVIPDELRYDPVSNPGGARCTVQDSAVNLLGRDPATGFARRPLDNTGVQYGLVALRAGLITVDDFLTLNRQAGGYDIDGHWIPDRMAIDEDLARLVYTYGGVSGRGAPEQTPMIDLRYYVDLVPILGFHDQVRPFLFDARLRERGFGANQAIWGGVPLASDAVHVAHDWAEAVDAAYSSGGDRAAAVAAGAATAGAADTCVVTTSADDVLPIQLGPFPLVSVPGCEVVNAALARTTTRIAAGGPSTDDVIKCQLAAPARADYPAAMTDAQFADLQAIFPNGVCDWSEPGVGETERSITWASVGGDELVAPYSVAERRRPVRHGDRRGGDAVGRRRRVRTGAAGRGGACRRPAVGRRWRCRSRSPRSPSPSCLRPAGAPPDPGSGEERERSGGLVRGVVSRCHRRSVRSTPSSGQQGRLSNAGRSSGSALHVAVDPSLAMLANILSRPTRKVGWPHVSFSEVSGRARHRARNRSARDFLATVERRAQLGTASPAASGAPPSSSLRMIAEATTTPSAPASQTSTACCRGADADADDHGQVGESTSGAWRSRPPSGTGRPLPVMPRSDTP